jgi:hypothetical protein
MGQWSVSGRRGCGDVASDDADFGVARERRDTLAIRATVYAFLPDSRLTTNRQMELPNLGLDTTTRSMATRGRNRDD